MLARILLLVLMSAGLAAAQHPPDLFVGQTAPELKEGDLWINSTPLTLESLRGKVVLIEFWAYDCEYCEMNRPYVKQWHAKYAASGLVVIGVHTPRIDYERDIDKVRESVAGKGIQYPVVIDNQYKIWNDYLGNVWPSHFVVDREGVIQLSQSGNGRYDETETVIQRLLNEQ